MRGVGIIVGLVLALLPAVAQADTAGKPWPPATGPGLLFVHFGEEHYNDADGGTLLPKVVGESVRYRPDLVTMSGDKGNDGTTEQLEAWRSIMGAFDRAGVPFFAGVGNHDRKAPPGVPGGVSPVADIANYVDVFAGRPYPFGDAAPYADPRIGPRERPAGDAKGASTHYFADVGNVRWIFVDNSCYGIINCDDLQNPPDGEGLAQMAYVEKHAKEATDKGMVVFAVMHMPTQDPRDQSYTDTTARQHTMGKGASPDNAGFERVAAATGIDGVFVAHIKGQFLYKGEGDVPYYIDGGAGGELYTTGPVGADHGYWHGYRLVRVDGQKVTTDTVPIFVEDGITVTGPNEVQRGAPAQYLAFGRQPVFEDPAKVEALELRDPDPRAPASGGTSALLAVGRWAAPLGLALLFLLAVARLGVMHRGRLAPLAATLGFSVTSLAAAVALAQQSDPTTTPKASLPTPARIWTTDNPRVLEPARAKDDDPRRDPATQTVSGQFTARCPGTTTVRVTSGWETKGRVVTVPSDRGTIVTRFERGARRVARGRRARVAAVRLAQPAVVRVVVRRGKKKVATLAHDCLGGGRSAFSFTPTRPGKHTVETTVFSDRAPVLSRASFRVR